MTPYQKALRVASDRQFRAHSRDALCSASKAARRARQVKRPDRHTKTYVALAGSLVLGSLLVWALRSLKQQ